MEQVTTTMCPAVAVPQTPRPSVIVYGPAGCGKTTNRCRIAAALGMALIIDQEDLPREIPRYNHLVLTANEPMPGEVPSGVKTMAYADAMKLRTIPGWPYEPDAMSIAVDRPIYHNRELSVLKAGLTLTRIDNALSAAIVKLAASRDTRLRHADYQKRRGNLSARRQHLRAANELLEIELILNQIVDNDGAGIDLPF